MENESNLIIKYNKALDISKKYKMTLEPDNNSFKLFWYNPLYEHKNFKSIDEVLSFLNGGLFFLKLKDSGFFK